MSETITLYDPSWFATNPVVIIDPVTTPKTTQSRDSGFSIEEDEAYRIAVAHHGYRGNRGEFWCNKDDKTKRLRKAVFGIIDPTPVQVAMDTGFLDIGPGPLYRSHRQDDTRQNQKKKLKRRKAVLKRHR